MATQLKNKAGKKAGSYLAFMDDFRDDKLEIEKSKSNHRGIRLEFRLTAIRTTGFQEVKCDYGHYHQEPVKERMEFAYITMDEADIRKLRDFLNDEQWFPKKEPTRG